MANKLPRQMRLLDQTFNQGQLFNQMHRLYGPKPTMLNVGLFSCATELAPMVGRVMLVRKQAQGTVVGDKRRNQGVIKQLGEAL